MQKKFQTPAWALTQMTCPHAQGEYKLSDIAKHLQTPEVVKAAVCNGYAMLDVLPEENRSADICLAACISDHTNLDYVPEQVLTMDFLQRFVSAAPHNYSAAYYLSRRGREDQPFSKEDVELALTAIVPVTAARDMMAQMTVPPGTDDLNYVEQVAIDNFGRFSTGMLPAQMVMQALKSLLSTMSD